MLDYYKSLLDYPNDSLFLNKYLADPYLLRLKGVGYFCGMDYASKDIYNFSEYISRFDHSLTVALLIYKLTKDKTMTLAGLYHDIATPCFSHVIDYMNNDYLVQETTEADTKKILEKDFFLQEKLKEDNINLVDIINYKQFSLVDNDRPKLCADRFDAIILNSIGWLKNISKNEIKTLVNNLMILNNEDKGQEIGFKTLDVAKNAVKYNNIINQEMHSKEDVYMMNLLAEIVKYSLNHYYIKDSDLMERTELEILMHLKNIPDEDLANKLNIFKHVEKNSICNKENIMVKNRNLKPVVNKII